MIWVGAVKFHLCLQRNTVSQSSLEALVDGVARRIDIVVEEFKNEVITSIGDWEVLREHLIQAIVLSFLRRSVQLQEIAERLQLHVEKIRIRIRILHAGEVYSFVI